MKTVSKLEIKVFDILEKKIYYKHVNKYSYNYLLSDSLRSLICEQT